MSVTPGRLQLPFDVTGPGDISQRLDAILGCEPQPKDRSCDRRASRAPTRRGATPYSLEFFVDFETVNNTNDDFRRFPEKGGQPLIFMIGCGHMEEGRWRFRCFVADRLTPNAEAKAIDAWIEHMRSVGIRLGVAEEAPRVFHWGSCGRQRNLETAYNSACRRHPDKDWTSSLRLGWFNLLRKVVQAQPVVVRGAFAFGLKEVAKALHGHGLIRTEWGDSEVDGLGAMVGAWHSDREAEDRGVRLIDTDLMQEIRRYNQVDCKVMQEILEYLRQHH